MAKREPKLAKRQRQYREARAILTLAAVESWREPNRSPSYYTIATRLGFDKASADVADEVWNQANGPDEGPITEERAIVLVNELLDIEGEIDAADEQERAPRRTP